MKRIGCTVCGVRSGCCAGGPSWRRRRRSHRSAASARPNIAVDRLHPRGFFPKGEDGAWTATCSLRDLDDLVFDIEDFNGLSVGGEWLFGSATTSRPASAPASTSAAVPSIYATSSTPTVGDRAGAQAAHRPGDRRRFASCRSATDVSSRTSASASAIFNWR